ncbi:MAG: hypothetical protein ACK56F_17735, partial [bacterium]
MALTNRVSNQALDQRKALYQRAIAPRARGLVHRRRCVTQAKRALPAHALHPSERFPLTTKCCDFLQET